jgi:DNA-binding NarL/FixJ family response regulator
MGRKVLVVDDEPHLRDLVQIWLEDDPRCGGVEVAADLETAVEKARLDPPDTVLLDFNVGARSAAEELPAIRAACPGSRIIVHTGNPDAARRCDVLALGADLLIEKASVSLDALVEAALAD